MKNALYFPLIALFVACGNATNTDQTADATPDPVTTLTEPSLEMAWETDTVLTTVESVLYDAARGHYYVANVANNPWEMDGNGFISVVGKNGEILEVELVREGLNGPKGMGLRNGKLFVADITAVVEIDVETGQIVSRHEVPGGTNLNDITVTADAKLYVSDSATGKAHRMEADGGFTTIVEGVQRPNGLLALENGHLLLGDTNGRELLMVNPADGSKEVFAKGVEPDGIIAVGDGSYVVSRWGGQIHHVSATGETTLLLDTEAAGSQTADIAYNQEEGLILVPTFFQNKVVAYRLKM